MIKLLTVFLLGATLTARCGPLSTDISEKKLSFGYSRNIDWDVQMSPKSNLVLSPNRRPLGLYNYQLISESGSITLVSNLPYASQFCLELTAQDLNKDANKLVIYNNGRALTSILFPKERTRHFIIHVGPKTVEELFLKLYGEGLQDHQNVQIKIERIYKIKSSEMKLC